MLFGIITVIWSFVSSGIGLWALSNMPEHQFIIFISMFLKTKHAGHIVVSPTAIIIGIVVSVALLVVHEFLHAIVYPSKARVVIGFVPKEFMAVALTSYPLRRSRFIVMCLLPYLLGVIPIILFCISPATNIEINGFLFGLSFLGLTSPCVDGYNVFQALRQTKEGDYLQFYGDDLYAFSGNL
ncbi:DUF3267 domain-containing protein [Hespellia stercorisuis]|uniref:DUF3267 domain-containing protein n=1 Tax=Hespellia stercorisuis TaxID=180311 RepID=UPI0009338000|nr:DUF3267 domain-containing protein [Hespellia stercorisuis]